jgi:hypothetical protein
MQPMAGSKPGLERWVVYFDGKDLDLKDYRGAIKAQKSTAEIEEKLREQSKERYLEFEKKLKGFDAVVVDRWFLTPAVTVEISSGAVGTLRTLPGVQRIEPDRLIE